MHDLIVIGAGPAGLGAALQAIYYGLDVLVLERKDVGGRLRYAREIRNFPGFMAVHSSGAALVKKMRTQAQGSGMRTVNAECKLIDWQRSCFMVHTSGRVQHGRSVIIATGVRPVPLAIPGAVEAEDRIHFYWTDIPGIRGKTVAVIGAGEVAFDQACSLAEHGAKVLILARGITPRAFPGLVALARRKGVRIRFNAPVRSITAASEGRVVLHTPGEQAKADYVLAAIGSKPCLPSLTTVAKKQMDRRIYLAGDADAANHRQAAIAFGDGVQKAMRVYTMLRNGKPC